MKKILILMLLIPVICKAEEINLAKEAKSVIMLEASTGDVIYERNADLKLPPASMTKIMTMLLTIEAIENDILKWDEMVTVSENASSMGGSQILLETNEQMKVEDLFKGVAVASGNDAAVALAEKIAGSEEVFVTMMNKRAKELGLTNTNFKNPHGLDTANHYSTAKDMSIIARELIKHEKVLEFTSIYDTYLRENLSTKIWLVNTNKLVKFYKGVDGLKTGYTKEAGYCLTSTAKRNNMRLITVIMGSETSEIRNKETTEMLDYGFAQYKLDSLLFRNSNLGEMKINNGEREKLDVFPEEDITFLKKKTEKDDELEYKLKLDKISAPVKKNTKVGVIKVYKNGKKVKEVNAIVKENVNKVKLLDLYIRNLSKILFP